jgi:hypothetical protein
MKCGLIETRSPSFLYSDYAIACEDLWRGRKEEPLGDTALLAGVIMQKPTIAHTTVLEGGRVHSLPAKDTLLRPTY